MASVPARLDHGTAFVAPDRRATTSTAEPGPVGTLPGSSAADPLDPRDDPYRADPATIDAVTSTPAGRDAVAYKRYIVELKQPQPHLAGRPRAGVAAAARTRQGHRPGQTR